MKDLAEIVSIVERAVMIIYILSRISSHRGDDVRR